MPTLRIVSYNIHKGRTTLGRHFMHELGQALAELNADMVFLQEIQGRNQKHSSLDQQPEKIMESLGMEYVYGCNAIRQWTDHGNALFSRFPVIEFDNQDISDHRFEQRGVLHASIDVQGMIVHCLVAHLGLFARSRERQAMAILNRIRRLIPTQDPVILAGDFNDWTQRLAPYFEKDLNLKEVFERQSVKTFPAFMPVLKLDCMYQRGFYVEQAKVVRGGLWQRLSDHAPIMAELGY